MVLIKKELIVYNLKDTELQMTPVKCHSEFIPLDCEKSKKI